MGHRWGLQSELSWVMGAGLQSELSWVIGAGLQSEPSWVMGVGLQSSSCHGSWVLVFSHIAVMGVGCWSSVRAIMGHGCWSSVF